MPVKTPGGIVSKRAAEAYNREMASRAARSCGTRADRNVLGDERYFLGWLADRLVHVYGESPNVDFVLKLRELAK